MPAVRSAALARSNSARRKIDETATTWAVMQRDALGRSGSCSGAALPPQQVDHEVVADAVIAFFAHSIAKQVYAYRD